MAIKPTKKYKFGNKQRHENGIYTIDNLLIFVLRYICIREKLTTCGFNMQNQRLVAGTFGGIVFHNGSLVHESRFYFVSDRRISYGCGVYEKDIRIYCKRLD